MKNENKMIIYQVFTRLFGNNNNHCIYNGDISQNGCGKMAEADTLPVPVRFAERVEKCLQCEEFQMIHIR